MPLLIATIVEWSDIPTFAKLMSHIFDRVRITEQDRQTRDRRAREEEKRGREGARDRGKARYCALAIESSRSALSIPTERDSFTSKLTVVRDAV